MRRTSWLLALLAVLAAPGVSAAQPFVRLHSAGTSGVIDANGETVTLATVGGLNSLKVQTVGTYAGTWELQCSLDGETFDDDDELTLARIGSTTTAQSVSDAEGIWDANIAGCVAVRVIATAWTSGSVRVLLQATSSGGGSASGGGGGGGSFDGVLQDGDGDPITDDQNDALNVSVVDGSVAVTDGGSTISVDDGGGALTVDGSVTADTELPSAAALADGTANPTVPSVGAYLMAWNGSTWDRMAVPAAKCDDPSKLASMAIELTAGTGMVQVVAADGSDVIDICGYTLTVGGASVVRWTSGTGTNCGTSSADHEAFNFAAEGDGVAVSNGGASQFRVGAGRALCIERDSSVTIFGRVTYVQEP